MMLLKETTVPKRTLNALAKKKIYTTDDLVRWTPRAYRDYTDPKEITECEPDTYCAVHGTMRFINMKSGNRDYMSIKIEPDPGIRLPMGKYINVLFFSRLFLYDKFEKMLNAEVIVCGKVEYNPDYGYSIAEPDSIEYAYSFKPRIDTIYPKVGGVSDENLRRLIDAELCKVKEPFEWELMQETGLISYYKSLHLCHHPKSIDDVKLGDYRLKYNDLLYFAMGLSMADKQLKSDTDLIFTDQRILEPVIRSLPYELTKDQNQVLEQMIKTTASGERLNMLLQGDVGSGKTIVGILLMLLSAGNGYQSVLMAPREVLAKQHYQTLLEVLETAKIKDLAARVVYLRAQLKAKEKKEIKKKIESGEALIIIGTHSCIAESIQYHKLGCVITDEEHLFGVEQKENIIKKAEAGVHILSMSATPIPRTIADILYGNSKTIAVIKSKPKGRLPIKSCVTASRKKAFPFMLKQIKEGRQCYVVCPAIEDNEETSIVSIERIEGEYRSAFEPYGIRVVTVNGKMSKEDAEKAVNEFTENQAQILISTTVIEVGVNVPNASVIVIEQAERFGLASLHQLRGRVGRGTYQSYCILLSEDTENERLKAICSTTDGFEIAAKDLKLRGAGNLLGAEQAGNNKYMNLMLANMNLFKEIRILAKSCVEHGFGEKLVALYKEHETAEEE